MTISLRSDTGGASGAVQVNGADKLLINEDGSMGGLPSVTGTFKNLKASATGTNANVLVTADELVLSSAAGTYKLLTGINLTGLAVTNTGANGLDAGLPAASTWYSVWVIWNGTTAAGLLSLSATAPTLPAGYTHRARVGWVRTDGTGNKYPLGFTQAGRRVQYKISSGSNLVALPVLASGALGNVSTPTYVAVSVSGSTPVTAESVNLHAYVSGSPLTNNVIVAPNQFYGSYLATNGTRPPVGAGVNSAGDFSMPISLLLESTNIYYAASTSNAGVICSGWEDNL